MPEFLNIDSCLAMMIAKLSNDIDEQRAAGMLHFLHRDQLCMATVGFTD